MVVQADARARHGRADRRRRRRSVCRLPAVPRRGDGRPECRRSLRDLAGSRVAGDSAGCRTNGTGARARARFGRAIDAAAARARHALEQLTSTPISKTLVGGPLDRSAAAHPRRDGRHDRPLAAEPAVARQLLVLPAGRSAGQGRPLHDGELARGAIAVPRSRADRVRRGAARLLQARWRAHQGDPARRVRGPDPREIDQRPKTGFGVPLDAWFRGELRELARDLLLSSERPLSRLHLARTSCGGPSTRHDSGAANEGQRLWALLTFERWLQLLPTFLRGTLPAVPA